MRRAATWILVSLLVACGGDAAERTASAPASAAPQPCWPVAAMRVMALEHGSEWEPVVELQGDGAIYNVLQGRRFIGRIKDDAVLDLHDVPALTCIHGEVSSPSAGPTMTPARYGPHDEYLDKGVRIEIADDGTVNVVMGSEAPPRAAHVRVEGPIARMRRTAALLVVMALAGPPPTRAASE